MEYEIARFVRVDKDAKYNIPSEMLDANAWLLWEAVPVDGKKPRKVPKYAAGGNRCGEQGSAEDRAKLVTFEQVMEARERAGSDTHGIGFALLPDSDIVCLDFDGAFSPEGITQENGALLSNLYDSLGTYTEFSPSEYGAHIFVKGKATQSRGGPLEIFSGSQFICITGETYIIGERMPRLREKDQDFFTFILSEADRLKCHKVPKNEVKAYSPVDTDAFDLAVLNEALSRISPEDYSTWVRIGMAIKSKMGDAGLEAWKAWSSAGSSYNEREIPRKWASFRRSGIGFGTIVAEAKIDIRQFFSQWRESTKSLSIPKEHIAKIEADVIDALWQDPVPIMDTSLPPGVQIETLPQAIAAFVSEQAAIIGCDQNALALSCIVAAAASIDDGIKIFPKRNDGGWTERACLWGAFVGDPSQKKTPAMSKAIAPIKTIDKAIRENFESELEKFHRLHEEWKLLPVSERRAFPFALTPPPRHALIINDATIESLASILKNMGRGVISVNDELGGWFGSMDAYNSGSGGSKDRPKWLELYNGGFRSIDRAANTICVPNWSASLLGGIQPDSIRDYLKHIPKDGLIQRFMIVCQSSKTMIGEDRKPVQSVMQEYEQMIHALYGLDKDRPPYVLSDGALMLREDIERKKIALIETGGLPDGCAAFVGKLEGLFCRLLLVWHLCEHYYCEPPRVVSEATAQRVYSFVMDFLLPHSIYFYGIILGGVAEDSLPIQIARHVLMSENASATNRELIQSVRAWRDAPTWERTKAMDYVEACGWVAPVVTGKRGEVKEWSISPKLKRDFGADMDAERVRRREVTKLLKSLKKKN